MNDTLVEIHSDSVTARQQSEIEEFCRQAQKEHKHASWINMDVDNWKDNSASLLYILLNERRFEKSKGGLFLLYQNNKIVAVSGYNVSHFEPRTYILGVRSWVLKEFRFNLIVAERLLPAQLKRITEAQAHTAILTFNEATKSFAKLIERSNREPNKKFKFFFGDRYPEIYKDMQLLPFPVKINFVKQWVLIKKLSPASFDWDQLRWVD